MPVIRFLGRVLPQVLIADFPDTPRTNWGSDDLGFPIIMQARISNSQIEVICEVEAYKDEYLSTFLARAHNLVDAYINAAAFATGTGMFAELFAVDIGDHQLKTITREHEELAPLCTAYRIPPTNTQQQNDFAETMRLILLEPEILGSMQDLADTLMHFHATPTNCGRVLDSLRRAVAPDLEHKRGWKVLQEVVCSDGDYMRWVSAYSADPRHGDRKTDIPKNITNEIRVRTWNVMNRFLEYRKNGSRPLNQAKFQPLVHDPSIPFPKP